MTAAKRLAPAPALAICLLSIACAMGPCPVSLADQPADNGLFAAIPDDIGAVVEDDFPPDSIEAGRAFFSEAATAVDGVEAPADAAAMPSYSTVRRDGYSYQVLDAWEVADMSDAGMGYVTYMDAGDDGSGMLQVVSIGEGSIGFEQAVADEFIAQLADQVPGILIKDQSERMLDGAHVKDFAFSGFAEGQVEVGGLVTILFESDRTVVLTSVFTGSTDGEAAAPFAQAHRSLAPIDR